MVLQRAIIINMLSILPCTDFCSKYFLFAPSQSVAIPVSHLSGVRYRVKP